MDVIKLNCGSYAKIQSVYIDTTFSNYIEGKPLFVRKLTDIKGFELPVEWGIRKTVFKDNEFGFSRATFPNYTIMVWLISKPLGILSKNFDASELVVVFTTNSIMIDSLEDIIKNALHDFNYREYAENFNY